VKDRKGRKNVGTNRQSPARWRREPKPPFSHRWASGVLCFLVTALFLGANAWAQDASALPASAADVRELREMVRQLAERDTKLESEVAELRAELHPAPAMKPAGFMIAENISAGPNTPSDAAFAATPRSSDGSTHLPAQSAVTAAGPPAALSEVDRSILDYLKGNTVNFSFDGYYGYNFNAPVGRVNLLRAYDVLSNAFSINQADVIFEHPTDVATGHRFGMRLDLQFGQATATLQGNPVNEPRPDIYRNIFQAYGTYVVPVGRGLTVDFGKWGSSLGIEGNYSKDQINYSRSLWFNALPFYHMGVRANLPLTSKLAVNYWVVNGTEQTEPTNGFKDQMFGLVVTPRKNVTWTINYYLGQEHPDVLQVPNTTPIPTQPGLSFVAIRPAPDGRLDIFDSYVLWQTTPKLTLALEGDYEIQRLWRNASLGHSSAPSEIAGTAGYAQYQLSPKWALGARAEYLSDPQGMFSGVSQALKETTATLDYKVGNGFLMRYEWRRDFSNQPYFLTSTQNVKSEQQNTATVGLIWWFGRKEGAW
jgi:Putative beta-barrel porin-2, OmpL-like. bbp2